jgi:quercetin dioxygenase-like cupin family protein
MADHSTGNPYKELTLFSWKIRYFPNKNPKDLYWHRDKSNRNIYLLKGNLKLQYDNGLPFEMKKFNKYNIMKMEYHRVISNKPFLLLIKEKT